MMLPRPTLVAWALTATIALFLILTSPARAQATGSDYRLPQVHNGMDAFEFRGVSVRGDTLALSDFRGKYVLLDFWGTWCAPCVAELPILRRIHRAYRDRLVILGIAAEYDPDPAQLRAFMREHEIGWPQLLKEHVEVVGLDTTITEVYEVTGYPRKYLIGPEGTIAESRKSALKTSAFKTGELDGSALEANP